MATLQNKVALVTGSASGIGRASARAFAREGAAVVVADVDEDGGHKTVDLIKAEGGEATFIATDVSDGAQVDELVDRTVSLYGSLDCAHNNAGIEGATVATADYPEDEFDRIIAVNFKGVWLSMKAEIPVMLRQGKGSIVNTSSTFGLVAVPNCCGYIATKHAITGLTRAAALEYARQGLRINAVCPGAIQTPLVDRFFASMNPEDPQALSDAYAEDEPIGRIGDPAEIGEAVVWLCSDAASFVTGLPMAIDGGWTAR
jgi:NAD(P)-dependent dehydrogenase (short-subunit alcohol dehydrogenase family)